MLNWLNRLVDFASEYLAHRKGLLPFVGIALILINVVLQFIPGAQEFAQMNLFLHLGVIIAILGLMLAWAL